MGKYSALLSVIDEEIETVDDDDSTAEEDKINTENLRSAAKKIESGNRSSLTEAEKSSVRDALEDVGNLYRLDGETKRERGFGQRAWLQAGDLGILYSYRGGKRKYVSVVPPKKRKSRSNSPDETFKGLK